jgi:hypothetical protein
VLHRPTAYLDDSGGKDTGLVVFSGFVSTDRKWKTFEREWTRTLAEFPEVGSYLHMRKFMHDGRIPSRRREHIEYCLAHIAKRNTLFPVSIAVDMTAYSKFQVITKNIEYYGHSADSFCFQTALGVLTGELLRKGYEENVAVVFDDGPQEARISKLYEFIKKQDYPYSRRLSSLEFKDDKNTPPLQAADLFAWEAHNYSVNNLLETRKSPSRVLSHLIDKVPVGLSKIWDSRAFGMFMEVFQNFQLDGVPLEFLQTPQGRLQASESFSRNTDKINLIEPPPERRELCREADLVEGRLFRKKGKKSRDNEPISTSQ